MTNWLVRVWMAGMLVALTPRPASAQFWDFIKWLNDMSGPQMAGVVLDVPLVSGYEDERRIFLQGTQFLDNDQQRQWAIGSRVGYFLNTKPFGSGGSAQFSVTPVRAFQIGASFTTATGLTLKKVAVDATGSVDEFRFLGKTVDDFWVPTITGGAALRYVGRRGAPAWKNGWRVSIRYQQFLKTFDGSKFGAPGSFRSSKEGIWQFGVGWILF